MIEIERKFLVDPAQWSPEDQGSDAGTLIRQGYLSLDPQRTVRVRRAGQRAWLTIKGITEGIRRIEHEYEIPVEDAEQMLTALCIAPIIDKMRYRVEVGNHQWEVDVFHGANQGLVVAEVELSSETEAFERPSWLGEEVSDDPRYFNNNLVNHPFSAWD